MLKRINNLKKYFFQTSSDLSTHYLILIENILTDPQKSYNEKQKIIQKILKLITNKIQIKLNEAVLFYGTLENHSKTDIKIHQPDKDIPFLFTKNLESVPPQSFYINKAPFFSYVWNDSRILKTFSIIGEKGFDFRKQENPENIVIHPLGIVVGFGNNHSSNAGLLDKSDESKINYTLTLTENQLSEILKNSKISYECNEIKLLLEIAQLFISYDFSIKI